MAKKQEAQQRAMDQLVGARLTHVELNPFDRKYTKHGSALLMHFDNAMWLWIDVKKSEMLKAEEDGYYGVGLHVVRKASKCTT